MKTYYNYFLIVAAVGLALLALWQWQQRRDACFDRDQTTIRLAREQRRSDSLAVQLLTATGRARAQLLREQADTRHYAARTLYETIRTSPASSWSAARLDSFLANPYAQLHSPSPGGPQRR